MIFIYTFLFFMASLVAAQRPSGNDEHFSHETNEPKCCECVPYIDCKDGQLNNLSKSKKPGQPTQSDVQKCEGLVNVCCPVINPSSTCNSFQLGPKAKSIFDNEAKETCDCTSWELCHPGKVVSDGQGPLSDLGLSTHSKCPQKNDVCCQSSPGDENAEPKVGDCGCVPQEQCVNGNVNTDGTGIIEIRSGGKKDCSNPAHVCCKVPKVPGNGAGNEKNGNYLAIICFVTSVAVLKGILIFQ